MFERLTALFNKTRSQQTTLKTDLHSHLIPGIDDGAKSMEESLNLVRSLKSLGYNNLITTPHIMQHRYPNTSAEILRGLEELRSAVDKAKIDITIAAAAEYYLDEHFMALLKSNDILTFGRNEILFEMSYVVPPPNLDKTIFEMLSRGYTPVLAHPERYLFMHETFDRYAELKEWGVRFQVNINSLAGYYSTPVKKTARKIMEAGLIDYLGSDTHHRRQLDSLTRAFSAGIVAKAFQNNYIMNQALV